MKKKFFKIFTVLALIFVCGIGFYGCDEKSNPITNVDIVYKNQSQIEGTDTIIFTYGTVYRFQWSDFNVVAHFQNGTTANIDASKLTVESDIPEGVVTPAGIYTVNLSYNVGGINHGKGYIVKVLKYFSKPYLESETFVFTGESPDLNIVNFNEEAMYISYKDEPLVVGYENSVRIMLNEFCCWEDGTTDEIRLTYTLIGEQIAKPTLKAEYQNGIDFNGNANRMTNSSYFDNFNADIMSVEEVQLYLAGTYKFKVTIDNPSFIFEGGATSAEYTIVVNPLRFDFPEFTTSFVYSSDSKIVFDNYNLNSGIFQFSAIAIDDYQVDAGEYTTALKIMEAFENSCFINEETIPNNVRYNAQEKWYEIDWEITKKTVDYPEFETEYVFDGYLVYRPFEDALYREEFVFDQDSDIEASVAGEYSAKLVLRNDNYIWSDNSTEDYVVDWVIHKAELKEFGSFEFGEQFQYLNDHEIGINFTIDDVRLRSDRFKLSTYTDENKLQSDLKLQSSIDWQLVDSQDEGDFTLIKYSFKDSDDISWVKEVKDYLDDSLNSYLIYQTIDLSDKQIGDEQALYLTYIPYDTLNYNEKVGIRNISTINEKGSQYIFTDYKYNVVVDDTMSYGQTIYITDLVANGDDDPTISYSAHKQGGGYEIFEYNHGDKFVLDVGKYYLYYKIGENEKYYGSSAYSGNLITINPLEITDEHITGLSASDINYLDSLTKSTISGKVYAYGVEVEGTYCWTNDMVIPDISDSNTTRYGIRFNPASSNYVDSYSLTLTVKVNPTANLTHKLPGIRNINENSLNIYEGDLVSFYDTYSDSTKGVVKNKDGGIVDGTWVIVEASEENWINDETKLKFVPNDTARYCEFVVENVLGSYDLKDNYFAVRTIELKTVPDFIFEVNEELKYFGGTIEVVMQTSEVIPETKTIERPLNNAKKWLENQYKIYYGNNSSVAYDLNPVIEVNDVSELKTALASEIALKTVVYVKQNITLNEEIGQVEDGGISHNFTIYVPEDVTLEIDKLFIANVDDKAVDYGYDLSIEMSDFAGMIVNCGVINFGGLGTSLQVRNFGNINVNESYLFMLDLYNDDQAEFKINTFGILEDELGSETTDYLFDHFYGHFINKGKFNFLYKHNYQDPINSRRFTYKLVKDSYNYGDVSGYIDYVENGDYYGVTTYYTEVDLEGVESLDDFMSYLIVRYDYQDSFYEEYILGTAYDGAFGVIVDSAEELYYVLKARKNGILSRFDLSIIIDSEIDVSTFDKLVSSSTVIKDDEKINLVLESKNDAKTKLIITENGKLILGEKVIGLEYHQDKAQLPQLINDGKFVGRVSVNYLIHNYSGALSYSKDDYLSGKNKDDLVIYAA